jgi:hypothetical protein
VQVTELQITEMGFAGPCPDCNLVLLVHVETSKPDLVKLTVVIDGVNGDRTYTYSLSGATSYDVVVPGGGQPPYPMEDACPRSPARGDIVVATASTMPGAGTDTEVRSCPQENR